MEGLFVRTGSVPGHAHKRKGINNQDALMIGETLVGDVPYLFGTVFDGCSGTKGSRTEVGASLLAAFYRYEIPLILAAHTPLLDAPSILYQRSIGYLGSVARSTVTGTPDAMWTFVRDYLLCTAIGFITDGETLVVYSAGDGIFIVDGERHTIDQSNRPLYLAYNLLDRKMLPSDVELPTSFEVSTFPLAPLSRFCISSDGLTEEARVSDTFTPDGIWDYEPDARAGLQWWLNKGANEEHRFSDDCTIVAFTKRP